MLFRHLGMRKEPLLYQRFALLLNRSVEYQVGTINMATQQEQLLANTLPESLLLLLQSSPSTAAFQAANERMHKEMSIGFTGNADADFIQGMIPHHEGAVAMAEIVLKHGKDPEARKLAQAIIKAQNDEISWMKNWLKRHEK